MPNRYTRESAIESEAVNALSWQGEVFFRRLINRVDDFGRHGADPRILRAKLFPLQLDQVSEKDVIKLLKENEKFGLLFTYVVDGKTYLVMNKWEKGRAKESDYPPPPENICEQMKTFVYGRKHMSADAPDSDSDSDTNTDSLSAEAVYAEYPKKVAKPDALRAILKALKKIPSSELLQKTRDYAAAAVGQNPQYIPHPATWFNAQRYNDEPATWFSNGNGRPHQTELPAWKREEANKTRLQELNDEFRIADSGRKEEIRIEIAKLKAST